MQLFRALKCVLYERSKKILHQGEMTDESSMIFQALLRNGCAMEWVSPEDKSVLSVRFLPYRKTSRWRGASDGEQNRTQGNLSWCLRWLSCFENGDFRLEATGGSSWTHNAGKRKMRWVVTERGYLRWHILIWEIKKMQRMFFRRRSVSYTHLTLPTILLV